MGLHKECSFNIRPNLRQPPQFQQLLIIVNIFYFIYFSRLYYSYINSLFKYYSPLEFSFTVILLALVFSAALNLPCGMQTVQQPAGPTTPKPRAPSDNLNAKGPRPLSNIVPSSNIRPASTMTASSVSTQTGAGQLQNQVCYITFSEIQRNLPMF